MAQTRHRSMGFSLIELVTVIVIIGVLAAFAVPKLATSFTGFERYAFRQELLAGLRYAQKVAIAGGCPIEVDLNAGDDQFTLHYENDAGDDQQDCGDGSDTFDDPVPDPTGGAFERSGESGANLETNDTLVFEGNGSLDTTITPTITTIELDNRPDIEINPVTGYVQQ